jgi:hypothetical protein
MVLTWGLSALAAPRHRSLFDQVETYCMFVGHARSGSTLLGALLSAHPSMVIAHELDALRFVRWRFGRDQLFELLLRKDAEFAAAGHRHGRNPYNFAVPDGWQGRFRELKVIGDKKAGASVRKLGEHPELLDRLRRTVGVPVRMVHTVRNPFDNISTIARQGKSLEKAVHRYFERCETIRHVHEAAGATEVTVVRHEELVAEPVAVLSRLCVFLGVDADEDYLGSCASIVRSSPNRTRTAAGWTPELIDEVERRIAGYRFLEGYTFSEVPDGTEGGSGDVGRGTGATRAGPSPGRVVDASPPS